MIALAFSLSVLQIVSLLVRTKLSDSLLGSEPSASSYQRSAGGQRELVA